MKLGKLPGEIITTALITSSVLFITAAAFAHEVMGHEEMEMNDAMAKQHKLMAMFGQVQAGINESLQKGDAAAVEAGARKILAASPDLKKLKPHKNRKDFKLLHKLEDLFEKDMAAVAAKAEKGDLAGARDSFMKAEEKCYECHVKFRD
jgi:cytochrome c556